MEQEKKDNKDWEDYPNTEKEFTRFVNTTPYLGYLSKRFQLYKFLKMIGVEVNSDKEINSVEKVREFIAKAEALIISKGME